MTDPPALAALIRKRAPAVKRVGFETGPLSVWFYHAPGGRGLPAICIDARHARAAPDMTPNKTDAKEADGLAHLAEVGVFRGVRVKGVDSMLTRMLVGARNQLGRMTTRPSNRIRDVMKTVGPVVPGSKGRTFERNLRNLIAGQVGLAAIVLPSPLAWRSLRTQLAGLGTRIVATARQSHDRRLLMAIPGVGAVSATSIVAAIADPANVRTSRSVGARVGRTTRRYQSGEVDDDGHVSRRGDRHLRWLLVEASAILLTRVRAESNLRTWGLKLRERIGVKRAAVAFAGQTVHRTVR